MIRYLFLYGFTFLVIACATTKKTDSLTVANALWQNWTGGIEGVGGTYYKVEIENSNGQDLVLESIHIDGLSLKIDEGDVKKEGKVIIAIITENRSAEKPSRNNPQPKPMKLRDKNPQEAILHLIVDGEKTEIDISSFSKATTEFYK